MHLVVIGAPPGVSWGLLGATNCLQKTIQDARGGFWGSIWGVLGSSWGYNFLALMVFGGLWGAILLPQGCRGPSQDRSKIKCHLQTGPMDIFWGRDWSSYPLLVSKDIWQVKVCVQIIRDSWSSSQAHRNCPVQKFERHVNIS